MLARRFLMQDVEVLDRVQDDRGCAGCVGLDLFGARPVRLRCASPLGGKLRVTKTGFPLSRE